MLVAFVVGVNSGIFLFIEDLFHFFLDLAHVRVDDLVDGLDPDKKNYSNKLKFKA